MKKHYIIPRVLPIILFLVITNIILVNEHSSVKLTFSVIVLVASFIASTILFPLSKKLSDIYLGLKNEIYKTAMFIGELISIVIISAGTIFIVMGISERSYTGTFDDIQIFIMGLFVCVTIIAIFVICATQQFCITVQDTIINSKNKKTEDIKEDK